MLPSAGSRSFDSTWLKSSLPKEKLLEGWSFVILGNRQRKPQYVAPSSVTSVEVFSKGTFFCRSAQLCRDCWAGLGARGHQLLTEARLVSLRHRVSENLGRKGCVNELGSEPVSQLSDQPGSATCPELVN